MHMENKENSLRKKAKEEGLELKNNLELILFGILLELKKINKNKSN